MKIGVYGGTFNPIHLGHTRAAAAAAAYLGLDRLLVIPAGTPPHKALPENMASGEDRLEMVRLAAGSTDFGTEVQVLDMELQRRGKSYTVDTMEALHSLYPEDELYLLMGTDMFFTFQNWFQAERIASLCTLCGFSRDGERSREEFDRQARLLQETCGAAAEVIPLPEVLEISSTELRQELARGRGQKYLCPAVYGYILRKGLYGVKRDLKALSLEELRCAGLSMLPGKRIPHVLGTEETAARLARRWGADEEVARRAALLHDCTKRLTREQHLALCRQYGVEVDEIERTEEQLLHGASGAAVAYHVFGLGREAASAIRWHTIGKERMTLLEKIIYLADYMEPTRTFTDLTEVRRMAMEDLDRTLLTVLNMSIHHLEEKGQIVHPNSVLARDYLKGILQ